ncbi:hypothetical protein TPHA_0N01250 [Tetrapisispora phaffii CBS 4417]|uniref:Mitochondrial carrier protein n=1 Tax=Tetrapisispora phaffii (strain ATCC 24235 / CBS 4417 / NBRC 1672 / NRRL Y-8282 / UCD 70-5) TaxID=1071381 RepID=G8C178_TETPH|nr:hypothetical protein TPHA_0N01250 [Tetrapisispora phaffii CBS 4417]CCE65906.1 hypothetical protein TPHA_0N01250 [Tetrapisispora phaffii CBS 4417]
MSGIENGSDDLVTSISAGTVAAMYQTTIAHPFEFLKTGLQLQRSVPGATPFSYMYKNKIYFRGLSALNVSILFKTTARFTMFSSMYELLKDPEHLPEKPLSGLRLLAAGASTGFVESLVIIPFENLKTTMIENSIIVSKRQEQAKLEKSRKDISANNTPTRTKFHKGSSNAVRMSAREQAYMFYEKNPSETFIGTIREIYKVRGIRGYFQGSMPTILRQVGNSMVRFTTYTTLKQIIVPTRHVDQYTAFILGFVSSAAVVGFTQPIDVIKTRMQSKYAWKYYKNSINCAYRIFVEEGMRVFWKGWLPRLFKVGISGGVSFGIYQYTENIINTMRAEGYLPAPKFD